MKLPPTKKKEKKEKRRYIEPKHSESFLSLLHGMKNHIIIVKRIQTKKTKEIDDRRWESLPVLH